METTERPNGPIRVAIVGGGIAGLAAAWQISQQSGYTVDVYEKSWRLGGKASSVRDAQGCIIEHGLHVWLGFYENAFRMMRECYSEVQYQNWGPYAQEREKTLVHGSIDDAFFPEPHIGVAGRDPAKDWVVWSGHLPPASGLPGDELDLETNPFTLNNYLLRCFDLLKALMLSVIGPPDEDVAGKARPNQRSRTDEAIELDFAFDATRSPAVLVERMAGLLSSGTLITTAVLLQAVTILERWLQQLNYAPQVADSALELLEALAAQTRKQLRDIVAIDRKLRWKTEIIDIVMAIAVGLFRDRVLLQEKGFDAINHMDYRKWLMQHGATKTSVDSRFITGIYDLVFAYRNGDRRRPALAAGVALRGALRMFFTYRGSMFWRLRSGMGDAVFAPLYKVMLLEERKAKKRDGNIRTASAVRFHFLHTLHAVTFDMRNTKKRCVTQLEFTTGGDRKLLDKSGGEALDDLGCWPDDPGVRFAAALDAKQADVRTLEYNGDGDEGFDAVVFAMGIDDVVEVCTRAKVVTDKDPADFYTNMPPKWAKMGREVRTVATKSAQVWLTEDLEKLGWHRGSGLITALDFQFNTWADMTHTLPAERAWRRANRCETADPERARSVAYFCGVLSESQIKQRRDERARPERERPDRVGDASSSRGEESAGVGWRSSDQVDQMVGEHLYTLLRRDIELAWPNAFKSKQTALERVVRGHAQANFQGSDRYTLSLPGSIDDRISPLDRSVLNMTIAGDWTACGLDAGCIEAAVMSGMLAACAITGKPDPKSIIGYDHP